MATELDYTKAWVCESTMNFARYFYKQKTGRKFVIGDHHKTIADAIDKILDGDPEYQYVMFNLPPRYSKTELVVKALIMEGLARNPQSRFLHLSYSDDLVKDNSKEIMDTINDEAFQTLFDVRLTSKSVKKWYTTEGGGLYAVATGGQVTGFGAGQVEEEIEEELSDVLDEWAGYNFAGAIIIDDPVKPEDAESDIMRERVNNRYISTIASRVNSRHTPIIVVMQRLHPRDLCGFLIKTEGTVEDGGKWKVIELPAILTDDEGNEKALWPFKHSLEELKQMREKFPIMFQTQYMQNPQPLEGLMYTKLRTYDTLPIGQYIIKNYTDTADTGADFHCSIDYAEYLQTGEMYVLSVLFTKKPMEYTETEQARQMTNDRVQLANIESNNGGRGFARTVERNMRELGNMITRVDWFSQGGNKSVRIFSHAAEVQNLIYFPHDWQHRWPDFYNSVTSYMKEGRNAHDDAPDALTGMCEKRETKTRTLISRT